MKKSNWDLIRKQCQGELRSLPDLLAGKFPKALDEIFLAEGKGLFPTPQEIGFDCSCPDWASMCEHVAATLYGIGARLDEDPLLFFTMRQADTQDLVAQAVQDKTGELLARADKKSSRVIADADLSGLFGIDLDVKPDFSARRYMPSPAGSGKRAGLATSPKASMAYRDSSGFFDSSFYSFPIRAAHSLLPLWLLPRLRVATRSMPAGHGKPLTRSPGAGCRFSMSLMPGIRL